MRSSSSDFRRVLDLVPYSPQEIRIKDRRPIFSREHPLLHVEITDNIIAALEKGVTPRQKPWQSGAFEMPLNPTSGKPYRGVNAIHLMMSSMRKGFEDPRRVTCRQAQENGWAGSPM